MTYKGGKMHYNKRFIKEIWTALKAAAKGFMSENCLKFSASLAYYTLFSLGPILVLMISLAGIFYGQEAIQGKVFSEVKGLIGPDAAAQIQQLVANLHLEGKSNTALIISTITLLIGATSVFGDLQDSINKIWHIRAKPKHSWIKVIKDRILSSSLVLSLGFLLVVSLVVNGVILAFTNQLQRYIPDITVYLMNSINFILSFLIIFVLFSIIFKVLPDVKISWKSVRSGAVFTTILFIIGRFFIGLYLQLSGTQSTYGAAGSIVVVLLWVYYTAAILYFGVVFTREYAVVRNVPIQPADYAVHIEENEIEKEVNTVPPAPL